MKYGGDCGLRVRVPVLKVKKKCLCTILSHSDTEYQIRHQLKRATVFLEKQEKSVNIHLQLE